jgi:hypothetical protein
MTRCVRDTCDGAELWPFSDWEQIGAFIKDNTPGDNPVEYPCGACDEPIRRESFLSGAGGAFVCQRCHTAYHGTHEHECDLHPGAHKANVTAYDGWEMFRALGGALKKRSEIDKLKNNAERRKETRRNRKPFDPELRTKVQAADELVAEITKSEKVGGEGEVTGSTVWLVGHSDILAQTTPIPEGMSITFYSEPGTTSDQGGNTFVLETLGGSRQGYFVTGGVVNQMSFGATRDDEAARGRAKIIEETPNAYTIGKGPFAGTGWKLCGADDPSTCDHSGCEGVLGIVKREWPWADLRIIGCRATQARGRAGQSTDQELDTAVDLAARAASYEMQPVKKGVKPPPLPDDLKEKLEEAGLGNREQARRGYKPGNVQFEGDLRYLRETQIKQAEDNPEEFAARYREMPARARADIAISDTSGVLQNPKFKIADLQAETSRTSSQITNYLISLSMLLCEARDLKTDDASNTAVADANKAIDEKLQPLINTIQDIVDGPEIQPVGGKLGEVLDKTEEVIKAAKGLIRAVEADKSIEAKDKPEATKKARRISDAAERRLSAVTATFAKLRQQAAQVIQLQRAAATDESTKKEHKPTATTTTAAPGMTTTTTTTSASRTPVPPRGASTPTPTPTSRRRVGSEGSTPTSRPRVGSGGSTRTPTTTSASRTPVPPRGASTPTPTTTPTADPGTTTTPTTTPTAAPGTTPTGEEQQPS